MIVHDQKTPLSLKVSGLKFFTLHGAGPGVTFRVFKPFYIFLHLLHVKEFSYKFYNGQSFSVCCK